MLAAAFLVMHFLKFNQKAHQADLEAEKPPPGSRQKPMSEEVPHL